jgi:uncharacterized protein YcbK (DUF882 family)
MGGGDRDRNGCSRRDVLRAGGLAALGLVLGPRFAFAARTSGRTLPFYCVHTGESLAVEYFAGGQYRPDGLVAVNELLRDFRTDTQHPIDPRLLDLVFALRHAVGSRAPVNVVSGYRSRSTNAMLRETGHHVATQSYHLKGRALDFFLPDRSLAQVRRVALAMRGGGVGYYPASNFVHLDTGPVRSW